MTSDLNASLSRLSRDHAGQWQIETIPCDTEWIAIDRTTTGDHIRVIAAPNLHALRFRLAQAERDQPEQPPTASQALASDTRALPAHGPGSGQHARAIIVRP